MDGIISYTTIKKNYNFKYSKYMESNFDIQLSVQGQIESFKKIYITEFLICTKVSPYKLKILCPKGNILKFRVSKNALRYYKNHEIIEDESGNKSVIINIASGSDEENYKFHISVIHSSPKCKLSLVQPSKILISKSTVFMTVFSVNILLNFRLLIYSGIYKSLICFFIAFISLCFFSVVSCLYMQNDCRTFFLKDLLNREEK